MSPTGGRVVTFAVPLIWNGNARGDVTVQIAANGPAVIESKSLRAELSPLLNDAGVRAFDQAVAGAPFIAPLTLAAAGFVVDFDMSRLELRLTSIAAGLRPVESLDGPRARDADLTVTHQPSNVSAYLNTNVSLLYRDGEGLIRPDVFWLGAVRAGKIVVEAEAGLSESIGNYQFFRQSVRAIYDQPEQYRRWFAGDVRLGSSPLSQFPQVGGLAVQKSRRTFDPSLTFRALGGQRILLDTPSTVEVLVNGASFRTLDLQPGTYDLSNLPIEAGANDIQLVIKDAAGRTTVTRLDTFFDPPDLEVGEDEYSAALGVVSDEFGLTPRYNGPVAALVQYRRALSSNLLLGGTLQLSSAIQLVSGEARFVPQFLPGSFELEVAGSSGRRTGGAFRAGYRWFGGAESKRQAVNVTIDYQSNGFSTLADLRSFSLERLSINANYSRGITDSTYVNVGGTFTRIARLGTLSTTFVDVNHRLNDRLIGTIGVEYGSGEVTGRNIGIRAGISILLGGRNRADVNYQSRRDYGRAALSRGIENTVGSLGYSLGLVRSLGSTGLDGSADYLGNRFNARLSLSSQGTGLNSIMDRQTARLQFGTSIAYADGMVGVGRPITDSFMLAKPAAALSNANAFLGRSLRGGNYEASSGPLGAAVMGQLQSYDTQDVQVDLRGPEPIYDIGKGLERLKPAYRSGYAIIVGNERIVSVVGNLRDAGNPVALISGTVEGIDDKGFQPQPFFTNSGGRFGIMGLAPGHHYRVQLVNGRSFTIDVPLTSGTLLRLNDHGLSSDTK